MESKDLIILGIVVGIGLFFVGAIISNVFPSNETNLVSYKVSAVVKLLGLGVLTTSMLVGGIVIEEIDKNLKTLLLLLGLIFLVIYSIASPALEWKLPSGGNVTAYETHPTGYGVPGFEFLFSVLAIFAVVLIIRRRAVR
ncbi:MAG TPA: hypothetical protein ENI42_01020 [Thermoplasmatales archaeon]|nr:hypothetical protein [Thermoplasmatales archaeon]